MNGIRLSKWSFLLLGLCLTVLVYWPGLSGGFLFDDYPNIVHNERLQVENLSPAELIEAGFYSFAGSYKRSVSMLSFALNLHFTGLDPFYLKLTNLILHLVNGVLVYLLCLGLLTAIRRAGQNQLSTGHVQAVAVVVALAWLLHPLNLTGVLYIVQRMATLATLFTLLGLVIYIYSRSRMLSGTGKGLGVWIGLPACTLLAALSKENGVLLLPLAFLTEVLVFRFASPEQRMRRYLIGFYVIFLLAPVLVISLYTLMQPQWLFGYGSRDFSLVERLMTQARVIFLYLQQILLPNITAMSLYHDTYELSSSLWSPPTTIISILGIAGLLWLAFWARYRAVILSFGILFFFVAHSIESTVLPLEIIFEHRNYLPSMGLLLILLYYLLHPGFSPRTLRIRWMAAIAYVVLLALSTLIRADQWGDNLALSLYEVERNPQSVRANFQTAREHASLIEVAPEDIREDLYDAARHYYGQALVLRPGLIEGLLALLILDTLNDKPVDGEVLAELQFQLAHSRLDPSAVTSFRALLNCQMRGRCSLPDGEIDKLIAAVEVNPFLGRRYAGILYSRIAVYLWEHKQDYQSAITFGGKAVQADESNIQVQINYAHMLLAVGEPEAVRHIIQQIRQGRYGLFYDSQLKKLEQEL